MYKRNLYSVKFLVLCIVFVVVFFVSFFIGRYNMDIIETIKSFIGGIGNIFTFDGTKMTAEQTIFINVRFPRILSAAMVGASLSVAGVAYQGMFRNPMVSPDLLGASTGAGFGAALAILMGLSYFAITISSFSFGLLAVFLAYLVGKAGKLDRMFSIILAGMIVSSLFGASTSFVKLVADTDNQLPAITYWLMGSLSAVKQKDLLFAAIPMLIGFIPLFLLRWRINLLTLSNAEAETLGINTKRLRLVVIICATLMTSASVAISGIIGWVGLVVPHFCRIIFGYDYRRLIPASALFGASFLIVVDDLSRTITSSEIPIGILTAFVGAPVFLYLLIRGGARNEY